MTITAPLSHTSQDGHVITLTPHMQVGYLIQARSADGVFVREMASRHNLESQALRAFADLVEAHPATPAQPTVKLAPAAKGTQTKVSDPQHTALAIAHLNGFVARGGKLGQAPVPVLTAAAKRHYLKLVYETGRNDRRKVVVGATITGAGIIRLGQLTAADVEAARIAKAVAGDVKTDQPVAA